jgi:hypothetical protein
MTATMARTLNCILKVGGLFGVGEAGRLVKGVGGVVEESGVRER